MSGRTKKRSLVLMEGQVGDPHMRVMSDHADMTASLTMASTIDSTTLCENDPKIFQRSGKWSVEEEAFANRLIFEFENGILADCEDGCTLRSYLARKLRCAPMRISKKFAGRCIGKLVFTRRTEKKEGPASSSYTQRLDGLYNRTLTKTSSSRSSSVDSSMSGSGEDLSGSEENSTIPDDNSDIDVSLPQNGPNKRRASLDLMKDEFHPHSFFHINENNGSKHAVLDPHAQYKGSAAPHSNGTRGATPGMHAHHQQLGVHEEDNRYMHDAFDIDFDYPSSLPVAPFAPVAGPWEKQVVSSHEVPPNEPDEWTEVLSLFGQADDHDWSVPSAAGPAGPANTGSGMGMTRNLSVSSFIL